jgi:hypothetical protein
LAGDDDDRMTVCPRPIDIEDVAPVQSFSVASRAR